MARKPNGHICSYINSRGPFKFIFVLFISSFLVLPVFGFSIQAQPNPSTTDEGSPSPISLVDAYSTAIGGRQSRYLDRGYCIAFDSDGQAIVAGTTTSDDFPTTSGVIQRSRNDAEDIFICKIDTIKSKLIWSTYLGGERDDRPSDIVLDDVGNIYIVGSTDSNEFPTTEGAFQIEHESQWDVFVCKVNPSGTRLLYSTYIGGYDYDFGEGIAIDDAGRAYIVGDTMSEDFNVTPDALYPEYPSRLRNGYLLRLSEDGSTLEYSTFIGGSRTDHCYDIDVDKDGYVYVTGATGSSDFPITQGAFQVSYGGGIYDGFVIKLESNMTELVYSTYFGGSGDWPNGIESPRAMAVDTDGNVIVTGRTSSFDFPTTPGAYSRSLSGGNNDVFLLKLNTTGASLVYSTFYGGSERDEAYDLTIDPRGYPYITGYTGSSNFPVTSGSFQDYDPSPTMTTTGFVTRFSIEGDEVLYTSFLGGSNHDLSRGVALDDNENVYVTGYLTSTDFPTTPDALYMVGGYDAFVCRLPTDLEPPVADAGKDRIIDQHQTITFDGRGSRDNIEVVNWSWSFEYGGEPQVLFGERPSSTFDLAGSYDVELRVTDRSTRTAVDHINVLVNDITPPNVEAGSNITIDQHQTVLFNGTGSDDNIGIVNWSWTFEYDDTPISLFEISPSFTFDIAGVYQVNLTLRDEAGNSASDSMTLSVRDITSPVANAGQNISEYQFFAVTFDARLSSDNVGIVNWTWTFVYDGEEVNLFGMTTEFTFDIAGIYNITLTVSDAAGNEVSDTLEVEVIDVLSPNADAGDDITIEQHKNAWFDAVNSTDNVEVINYTWTFEYDGETVSLYGALISYLFDIAGEYEVELTVTDAYGNYDTDTIVVKVIDTENPTSNPGGEYHIDQHKLLVLDGLGSIDNTNIENWTWTFVLNGTTIHLYGSKPTYVFDDAGIVHVNLTVVDQAGNSARNSTMIIVRDVTNPVAVAGQDTSSDKDKVIQLDGSASTDNVGIVKWTWTVEHSEGKTFVLEGVTTSFKLEKDGWYRVTLTVEDAEGNTDEDSFRIDVKSTASRISSTMIALIIVILASIIIILVFLRTRSNQNE